METDFDSLISMTIGASYCDIFFWIRTDVEVPGNTGNDIVSGSYMFFIWLKARSSEIKAQHIMRFSGEQNG